MRSRRPTTAQTSAADGGASRPRRATAGARQTAGRCRPAPTTAKKADDEGPKHKPGEIDVVLVADIDCLYSAFFQLRARGSEEEDEIEWRFENVTFVLNVLDSLAGDDRFIEIRKHRPVHRTLTKVAAETEPLLKQAEQEQQKFSRDFDKAKDDAQAAFNEEIAKVQKQTDSDPRQQQSGNRDGPEGGRTRLERQHRGTEAKT